MDTASPETLGTRNHSLRVRLIPFIDRFGILLLVVVMVVIGAISQPGVFLSPRNLQNIPGQNAANAILAIGMFVVILTAGIDLSVGSTLVLAMMCTAVLSKQGWPPGMLIVLPLVIGATIGLTNGLGYTDPLAGLTLVVGAVLVGLMIGQPAVLFIAILVVVTASCYLVARPRGSIIALSIVLAGLGAISAVLGVLNQNVLAALGAVVFVAIAIACGAAKRMGVTDLRLPHPFIVTLATLNIARGLANLVSGGVPVSSLPDPVRFLGSGDITIGSIQIPASLLLVTAIYLGFWVFLQLTRTGRHIYAIGGNPQAARVSGINVDGTLVLVYLICGTMAGLAGLLVAGRTNSGFPNAGIGAELDAISAVIIGGASFFGGRGTVLGVLTGVLVIGLLRNILNLNNVQVFWQQILIGVVIFLAVFLDVVRRRAGSSRD
jgi:ribose transport system permease protein